MKKIQLRDFLDFKFLSQLEISSDGKYVLFAKHKSNEKDNNYTSNIWSYDRKTKTCKEITHIGTDKDFTFLDNKNIICSRTIGVGAEPSTLFEKVSIETGKRERLFKLPFNVSRILPINSKEYIIYASVNNTNPEDLPENGEDWVILEELPFASNGKGFTSGLRNKLYIYNSENHSIDPITSKYFQTKDFALNSKSQKIVYFGSEYRIKEEQMLGIYVYDLKTKETTTVLKEGHFRVRYVDTFKDKVIFSGSDTKKYNLAENDNIYEINIASKDIQLIHNSYQMPINNWILSDCRYGEGNLWKIHRDDIYYIITENESSHIVKINSNGEEIKITSNEGSIDCFDIYEDEIIFVGMRNRRLQELYSISIEGKNEKQLTSFNEEFYKKKETIKPESCNFINYKGDLIQGFVLKPTEFDETKEYPGILNVHGGPKTTYGTVYFHEMQFWANNGYFVFYCNPTGSDGRGDKFGNLLGRYGTVDYHDVMKFTDIVLKRYPNIDKNKLGVTGGSYGGFLTNFIVGNTNRFAAAVSQRSIANWISQEGASDSGYFVAPANFGKPARMNIEKSFTDSPLNYINNVRTPILFIHSEEDFRCPPAEAFQMFTIIMDKGVETRLCMFKDEDHELSRTGKPKNRIKRLEEITNWMDKYLTGESI